MRTRLATLLIGLFTIPLTAQEIAVTESGDSIFIYDDGTWSYDLKAQSKGMEENVLKFQTLDLSIENHGRKFTLPSQTLKKIDKDSEFYKISYNPSNWKRVPPATINPIASYTFGDESKGIYAMLIAENIEMGTENIYKFALQHAETNAGAAPKVLRSEWVMVNGVKMINGEYDVNLNGLKFTFNSLFYSTEKGTIQLMTWTFTNQYTANKPMLEEILAGLEIK